ncbi:MAG: prepilin-type N-terminal cleavage/methylation domain-containing protein [Verrucomicrobiota bacterium]
MNGRVRARRRAHRAFTLLEVAVASAVLALALFAVLRLCAVSLRMARALDRVHVDASSLAAELSLTNRLEEGSDSGNFGDLHPGYSWSRTITEYNTNGLFQVDFMVFGGRQEESRMSILLYRPDSIRRAGR